MIVKIVFCKDKSISSYSTQAIGAIIYIYSDASIISKAICQISSFSSSFESSISTSRVFLLLSSSSTQNNLNILLFLIYKIQKNYLK